MPPYTFPKRPLSAYMLFCKEKRSDETIKSKPVKDQAKALGELWRGLAEDGRKKYQSQASELSSQYKVELDSLKKKYPDAKAPRRIKKKRVPKVILDE